MVVPASESTAAVGRRPVLHSRASGELCGPVLEGRVLAGIGVEVVSSNGVKGPAIVVRMVESPEMMFAAEQVAARLRLSGFFGLDFMIDDSGAIYIIEMNRRCTPLCPLQLGGVTWWELFGRN